MIDNVCLFLQSYLSVGGICSTKPECNAIHPITCVITVSCKTTLNSCYYLLLNSALTFYKHLLTLLLAECALIGDYMYVRKGCLQIPIYVLLASLWLDNGDKLMCWTHT